MRIREPINEKNFAWKFEAKPKILIDQQNYKTIEYVRIKGVLNSIELRMLRRVDYLWERNILESHVFTET